MNPLNTAKLARLLREFGQRSSLRGGNPYRAKAYARAAESLGALAQPLDPLIAEGRLQEIPGVGAAIADIITKLHRTGTHPSLESMRKDIPEGVLEMLSVPGLRPDKVLSSTTSSASRRSPDLRRQRAPAVLDPLCRPRFCGTSRLAAAAKEGVACTAPRCSWKARSAACARPIRISSALPAPAISGAAANWLPIWRWWPKRPRWQADRRHLILAGRCPYT
jgi:hypothetical protein